MGLYIEGMEMPAMCSECDFCGGLILPDNIHACDCPSEKIHGKNITRAVDEDCRHPNCPLIEVPEPHGRLGDLDELRKRIEENIDAAKKAGNHEWWYACTVALDFTQAAQAIIEAEEG